MPLEFALRPRFNLEREAPQRKLRKRRLSPLALPMLGYWLAIAGATHLLLRSVAEEPAEGDAKAASMRDVAEADAAPASLPSPTPRAPVMSAPPAPAFEPAPKMLAAPEHKPDLERTAEPSTKEPEAPAPRAAERPAVFAPAPLPPARRSEVDAPPSGRASERPVDRESERSVGRESQRDEGRATSLPSCESAAASANETMDLRAAPSAPDLPREAFSSVLENGAYLARCAIPARTALEVCAAVQDGKVVGVSITTEPLNPSINACVRRAVATLRFPASARLDVTRTHFAAAR